MFLLLPFVIWMFDTSRVLRDLVRRSFTAAFDGGLGFVPGWFVKLVALALIWAYLQHFCAGLRHLWMDVHARASTRSSATARRSSRSASAVVLTLVLGAKLFGVLLNGDATCPPTIGSKRLVVGAHYGLRDWLAQRVTARR